MSRVRSELAKVERMLGELAPSKPGIAKRVRAAERARRPPPTDPAPGTLAWRMQQRGRRLAGEDLA